MLANLVTSVLGDRYMAHPYYHQYAEAMDLAERASKACYYSRGKKNFVPAMTELVATLEKNANARHGDGDGDGECEALAQLARVFAFEDWDGRDPTKSKRYVNVRNVWPLYS